MKNQSITGFMLSGWFNLFPKYLKELIEDQVSGKLKVVLDFGEKTSGGQFNGLEGAIRAVEVSQQSIGKII
jgi:hypothetical protein